MISFLVDTLLFVSTNLLTFAGYRDPDNLFVQSESNGSKSFTSKGLTNEEISVDNLMRFK